MTDQLTPPPPPAPGFASPKDAKAQAKAAKAYTKASRPWFKKKRFILLIAIVLIIAISQAVGGGGDAETTGTAKDTTQSKVDSAPAPPKVKVVAAGIGTKVRDGKFEFVVTGVERPGKTIAGQFGTSETAQGEFVIVRVNVTNVGNEGQMLDSSSQQLFNDKGQKFAPSSAIMSLKDADKFFLQNINPGNTVKGAPLLFDVAPGTKIANIELHDSPFSDGVKVKVS